MPSTPASISRCISAGSLTVHGNTASPRACASATSAGVRLRQNIDHVLQPAALTSAGTEPPSFARLRPACQRDAPSAAGVIVFMLVDSIVRHDVRMRGSSFLTSTSVRQSNDWIVTRSRICASCSTSMTTRAKAAGSGASPASSGVSLVSTFSRTGRGAALTSCTSSASVGNRSPSAGRCSGKSRA
jgi:hypothetical protein